MQVRTKIHLVDDQGEAARDLQGGRHGQQARDQELECPPSPETVGELSERLLQCRLGQAIDTNRQTRLGRAEPGHICCQQHEYRQYHEQTEHAKGDDTCKCQPRTQFN